MSSNYITAKQLAEELLKNPDDIIAISSDNFELNNAILPKNSIYLNRFKGIIKEEYFTDSFDGGSYKKNIIRYDDNGEINFVKL